MRERRLSLVVPSYNRAPYLQQLLTSLTWSSVPPSEFEVVVVNDGGTDDLPGVVDHWRRRGLDVRLVTLRTGGAPRNNARARNAGLAVVRYPIVVQTDPDIVFLDDVLAAVRDGVDGRSLCSCDGYFPLTREDTETRVFQPGAVITADALRAVAAGRPNQVHSPDGVGGLHGAFACATQVLRDLGGYDESFEHWGWEDRELLVTAASRGFRRRTLAGTHVAHLWHPVQRGDLGRESLAAAGQVSRTAWDVQMQRVAAELPRRDRVRPAPRAGATAGAAPVAFDARAVDCWRSATDDEQFRLACARLADDQRDDARAVLPRAFQMAFDALVGEADVLATAGHLDAACTALTLALHRPWEPRLAPDDEPGAADPAESESGADGAGAASSRERRRPSPLGLYDRVDDALERLTLAEHARGRRGAYVRALDALAHLDGGEPRAAALRLRMAMAAGDRRASRRHLAALEHHTLTPGQDALALECLLLDGRLDAARDRLTDIAASARRGDYFDRLRAVAYARLIGSVDDTWCDDPAARDTSEFLFSVGVRAERAGLDVAAWQCFRTFLDEGGPAEPRLRASAAARMADARARITRVAGTALGARLCAAAPVDGAQAR